MDIDQITAALRALVFEDSTALLTPALLTFLRMEQWRFLLLKDPSTEAEVDYRGLFLTDLKQRGMLNQITVLFAGNDLRWCPIKGADLAWRVWPEKMIRFKGDLDVLIHPDDRERAREILLSAGWTADFHGNHPFHEAMMKRHGVALELHFGLPEFGRANVHELWDRLIPQENGKFRLPLELNLVLLFAHACSHDWWNGLTLMLDCGFLIRHEGAPDWEKVEQFVRMGQTISPALFFCSFPDFFPEESIPEEKFSAEAMKIFRQVILTPPMQNSAAERAMEAGNRYSLAWWSDRFRAMSPNAIRAKTQNPQGHYGKLLAGYWTETMQKLRAFWKFRRGTDNLLLRNRLQNGEYIESLLKKHCTNSKPPAEPVVCTTPSRR